MSDLILPNYQELEQALSGSALKMHPSQVHGLIAGLLCGHPSNHEVWESLLQKDAPGDKESHKALKLIYDASARQLADFLFEFQLIIPDDGTALMLRAEALTLWCQGFLTGLKMANIKITGREPDDTTEAINDLIEIAKMNFEEVVASDEDEQAFMELVEYIRMAVILIYQNHHDSLEAEKNVVKHLH